MLWLAGFVKTLAAARQLLLCAAVFVQPVLAFAEECQEKSAQESCRSGFTALLDNDVLLLNQSKNEDRNYTMGLAFQWSGRWIRERGLATPLYWVSSLKQLASIAPEYSGSGSRYHILKFGNVAFTPDRLNTSRPIKNDRPYGSLLFLDTTVQIVAKEDDRAFTSELSIGILGLSISKNFQRWLHKRLQNSPDEPPFPPEGWGNQISDGGEPTLRYTMRWQRKVEASHRFDFQWVGESNAGYHTNVGGGAAVRFGEIQSPWWQFTATPISQGVGFQGSETDGSCRVHAGKQYEIYGWAGSMGRLWGYNALLQGQFRKSIVTVDSSDVERFVYDYSGGATAGLCLGNRWHRLSISYSRRSPEFDGPMRRYHSWGGIYYSTAMQL